MELSKWSEYRFGNYNTQENVPYAMNIIVRLEKTNIPTDLQVKKAIAIAIAEFFASEKAQTTWLPLIKEWLDGRIRKITKRARGSEWEKVVSNVEGFHYNKDGVEIFIAPPCPVEETPSEIKKLQVSGLDLEKETLPEVEAMPNTLYISVNPNLEMSTGKSLAQVAHAVQVAIFRAQEDRMQAWQEAGMPMQIISWKQFNEMQEWFQIKDVIEIHDAGFTEIEAGSLTAKSAFLP
jgi:peptidyl-tRNA hydrolase